VFDFGLGLAARHAEYSKINASSSRRHNDYHGNCIIGCMHRSRAASIRCIRGGTQTCWREAPTQMVGRARRCSCTAPAVRGFMRVLACLAGSEVAVHESVCGERRLQPHTSECAMLTEPHRLLPPAQSQRQHQWCDTLHILLFAQNLISESATSASESLRA